MFTSREVKCKDRLYTAPTPTTHLESQKLGWVPTNPLSTSAPSWETSSSIFSDHEWCTQHCLRLWNIDKWGSVSVLEECVFEMGHQRAKYNKDKKIAVFLTKYVFQVCYLETHFSLFFPFWVFWLSCLNKSGHGFELGEKQWQNQT